MTSANCLQPARRHAFATFTALGLVLLLGAVVAGLTGSIAREGRYNQDADVHRQLRQLLLAGIDAARADAANWPARVPDHSTEVPVPHELGSVDNPVGVSVQVAQASSGSIVQVEVTASYRGMKSYQSLVFSRCRGLANREHGAITAHRLDPGTLTSYIVARDGSRRLCECGRGGMADAALADYNRALTFMLVGFISRPGLWR